MSPALEVGALDIESAGNIHDNHPTFGSASPPGG